MTQPEYTLKLTGIAGYCEGHEHVLKPGDEALIGRSRACDFRIENIPDTVQPTPGKPFKGTGDRRSHFLTVSGKHARLTFEGPGAVYVEDLSTHGTFVDGKRVEGREAVSGLDKAPREIRLGTNETLRLELVRQGPTAKPKITVKRRQET
jgi:pSer/pThr/pTyr-binding forkhead associated (FHA) protein